MKKQDILSYSLKELEDYMTEHEVPKFRAKQIFRWLHCEKVDSFEKMTNISAKFREELAESFYITSLKIKKRLVSDIDNTVKYLYALSDGSCMESVLMRYRYGNSLCISTQVGCKMGCQFCASTIAGFVRNLSPSEILQQIYTAEKDTGEKISNVVLMGIGEPLDNFDNVLRFLELVSAPEGYNMSLRHITLSTCGLVDKINLLAQKHLGLTLTVSLHAPNDRIRSASMPVNQRWNMEQLLDACRNYAKDTGRRVSFEYALIQGVNDKEEHALELAQKLKGMLCHVNLIPMNEVSERRDKYRSSKPQNVTKFQNILMQQGINTTVRRTLGADINAACGQLRREAVKKEAGSLVKIAGITDIGLSRDNNQDTFEYGLLDDQTYYALVCDGMGGENGGDIASSMASDIITERLKAGYRSDMDANSIRNLMLTAIGAANTEIYAKAKQQPELTGMGTTAVVIILKEKEAYISHVGDSRVYLFRNNELTQMTTDHSIVQELIAQGKLSESDADDYPHKNLLTRAVGAYKQLSVDYMEQPLQDGDKLLLCTDGLTNFCPTDILTRILQDSDIDSACKKLVNAACNAGGLDNITAIIAAV